MCVHALDEFSIGTALCMHYGVWFMVYITSMRTVLPYYISIQNSPLMFCTVQ